LRRVYHKIKSLFVPEALVLMYHRIAEPEADIWDIAVSAGQFEKHLQALKKAGNVVPLQELADRHADGTLKKNSIAITFDDGYSDNFRVAKPLLEKYQLPATFFITTGNIGQAAEFWWDELENIILFTKRLPVQFSMRINNQLIEEDLNTAELTAEMRQKHISWKACTEAPPTPRCRLYYRIWEQLKPVPPIEQQTRLQKIRDWAGVGKGSRPDFQSMSLAELKEMGKSRLTDIGAHTVSHPALAFHAPEFQKKELAESKSFLEEITERKIDLLAYPYGNYNKDTARIAADLNFSAAFTTEEQVVRARSDRFQLARFQVKNLHYGQFNKNTLWQNRTN
jgi:peptidoglycan/xylan/chitin deacetylase (PgdA/CDA1 family)